MQPAKAVEFGPTRRVPGLGCHIDFPISATAGITTEAPPADDEETVADESKPKNISSPEYDYEPRYPDEEMGRANKTPTVLRGYAHLKSGRG